MKITSVLPANPLTRQPVLIALALTGCYFIYMLVLQDPVTANEGRGWDGDSYYHMALADDFEVTSYPLWLRFGVPLLASHFPTTDVLFNFKMISILSALLFSVITFLLLARYNPSSSLWVPVIGWLLVCSGHLAPIPVALWYPIQIDLPFMLCALLFLVIVMAGAFNLWLIALLFFIGTCVRENFPQFLVYILLALRRDTLKPCLAVIASALVGSVAGFMAIEAFTGRDPFENKTAFVGEILFHYNGLPEYLSSTINSVSAVLLFVLAARWCGLKTTAEQALLLRPAGRMVFLAISLVALMGGTNTERYWWWGMPFFALCALPAIHALLQNRHFVVLGFCLLWAFFIQRSLLPIDADGAYVSCTLGSILLGGGNWLGHWTQFCFFTHKLQLVLLMAGVLVLLFILCRYHRRSHT